MTWTVSSGSQTATVGTEHILASPTVNATYVLHVDTVNMANGDSLELRVYDKVDGANYRQMWKGTFSNVQTNAAKASPFVVITTQGKFTLKQLTGTGRSYPWSLRSQ